MEVGEEDETENIIHMIFSLKKKKKLKRCVEFDFLWLCHHCGGSGY